MKKSSGKRIIPVSPPVLPQNVTTFETFRSNTSVGSDIGNNDSDGEHKIQDNDSDSDTDDDDAVYIGMPSKIQPWLHKNIDRQEAEKLLAPRTDGLFLLRESQNFPGDFTVCVCYQGDIEHYRIKRINERWFTIDDEELFCSLEELVKHYRNDADGLVTKLENYVCVQ